MPLIGIGRPVIERERCDFGTVTCSYINSLISTKGILFLLPLRFEKEVLDKYSSLIDGLITIGGEDVDLGLDGKTILPECGTVDRERDVFDKPIAILAFERHTVHEIGCWKQFEQIPPCSNAGRAIVKITNMLRGSISTM